MYTLVQATYMEPQAYMCLLNDDVLQRPFLEFSLICI